jgi:4-phospho-D-threonate 3-dehydrogenase / 4-phospho-D-erythronate 3-dehydrogenase
MESMPAPLPLLAVTLGDPSGVGPEIALKAAVEPEVRRLARLVLIGPHQVVLAVRDQLSLPSELEVISSVEDLDSVPSSTTPILSISHEPTGEFPVGKLSASSGRVAVRAVETAVRLALDGQVDAIVTAPLNKEAMKLAGYTYPGHTEILGALCGARATMLLAAPRLRVVHVSVHCSLQEAIRRVTRDNVRATIRTAHEAGRMLGYARPRIAVCGLNPHAGEGGLFGTEELEQIIPAVEDALAAGLEVSGPWPPDTVFLRASQGEFDIVVAMYHDQGHIAVKMFGLEGGVNVTLGLPIVRTSVDHGTAFDIAGKGIAQHQSMLEAIRTAVRMLAAREGKLHESG